MYTSTCITTKQYAYTCIPSGVHFGGGGGGHLPGLVAASLYSLHSYMM